MVHSEIFAQITRVKTSAEAWSQLQELHASSSGSRILQLRQQLQNIKKGDSAIDVYLSKVTKLVDNLITAGVEISTSEIIIYILEGIDTDYESIIAVISSQLETMTPSTMRTLLTNQEIRNTNIRSSFSSTLISVNAISSNSRQDRERPTCQICGKRSHIDVACHNKYNETLHSTPPEHRAMQLRQK